MSHSKEDHIELKTIDSTHNHECFNYLKKLKTSSRLLECFPEDLTELATLKDYNPKIAYGNLYTNFHDRINEKQIVSKINSELELAKARLEVQEDIKHQIPPTQKGFMKLFQQQLESHIKQLEEEKSIIDEQVINASFLY